MADQTPRILTGSDPADYPSRRVAVAMSGGIDSSLAAAMLLDAGFEVTGLTMLLLDESYAGTAGDRSAVEAATEVARYLGIGHEVIDLRDEFDRRIMTYFTGEYLSGRTPNPCIRCNLTVKWDLLGDVARERGYDLFATGHYVRIGQYPDGSHTLMAGSDPAKDQSYFLYRLSPEHLARTLFPLGGMTKDAARASAQKRGLPVADRSESQEICFIPDNDYRRFLRHRTQGASPAALSDGPIIDNAGNHLGTHRGSANYTIGQRRGLGIAVGHPLYVTAIDTATNTITAGPQEELMSDGLIAGDLHWTGGAPPGRRFTCTVRIRYRHRGVAATVSVSGDTAQVRFTEPQMAITPGQSAVFYRESIISGGGIIEKALK